MTRKETASESGRADKKDPLIGRSYLCCTGPRKGEAVTVMSLVEASEEAGQVDASPRYRLESERGPAWTISSERLHRIFGPSSKRSCNCHPLDSEAAAEEVETVKPEQVKEEPNEEAAVTAIAEESETVDESDAPPVSQVIYEGNNAQGALF